MAHSLSHSDLLRDVAEAIIASGYAVMPQAAPQRKRRQYMAHDQRVKQLSDAISHFKAVKGYRPRQIDMVLITGMSKTRVSNLWEEAERSATAS